MSADPDRPAIKTVIDPFAPREFQWRATYGDYDLGDPTGWGATEADAIADLTEWDEENDG